MIAAFFSFLGAGHVYIIIIVTAVQIISFKEVIAIANVPSRARSLRFTKSLNWYFLGTAMYFLYGESVIYYFKHILLVDRVLLPLATHHRFISFMLYIIGFVFFVYSLQKGHYKFQFTQFAWTHMALFLIVGQAHFVINNILEGFIWFILPVSMVITNDIWAYLCGITFGRTPLIQISPKKTWEGFLGAWFFTVLWGIGLTHFLAQYKYFICPVNVRFPTHSRCRANAVRISARTSTPASSANRTQSLSRATTHCPWSQLGFLSPERLTLCLCSFMSSSSRRLRRSLHPLGVSSPLVSSARSRSRTLAIPSPDTAA
jgi:phosphatidate cytidylyltransferase